MAEADSWDPKAYEADPHPSELLSWIPRDTSNDERVAVIRTSDRILFRRCRRRWGWQSHLRGNLTPKAYASPLWTGSGFHFALEDFHGARKYPSASAAFQAFADACSIYIRSPGVKLTLPADWPEQLSLAKGMLDYYEHHWLRTRAPLKTYVHDGVPQVEVNFRIELPWERGKFGYDRAIYSGTLDRVCVDENGLLWIVEYKTAKSIQTLHFSNDPQVSAYCWAGMHLYGRPIEGVIYQQHRKDIPEDPRILAKGKVSTDKRMLTTHHLYRQTLLNIYGDVECAPKDNIDFLNELVAQEDPDFDRFVRRDRVYRNEHQCQAEGVKILMELEEMLNPDLPLYPNATRDCQYMCSFLGPCVSMDDGSDWEYELDIMMTQRDLEYDSWRRYLKDPTATVEEGIFTL